jgi:two-component system nitrogen regulation sensor histidine kinase NtrY
VGRARATLAVHVSHAALGIALLSGALWLRTPTVRYLLVTVGATVLALVLGVRAPWRARAWTISAAVVMLLFCLAASLTTRTLARIEHGWPAYERAIVRSGAESLERSLALTERLLRSLAERALDAPEGDDEAFAALGRLLPRGGERAVVLIADGVPRAWAGQLYVPLDSLRDSLGVAFTPFYTTLYADAERGQRRAIATAVIHAEPPADNLAKTLAGRVAASSRVRGFDVVVAESGTPAEGVALYAPAGRPLLEATPLPPSPEEARLQALLTARETLSAVLAIALALLLAAVWRTTTRIAPRLLPLAFGLAAVAVLPLSTFSSASPLFDPTVYFAGIGGAFTASVAALLLSGALLLLALLILLRARVRAQSRWLALAIVLVLMVAGPFLLRDLARGVTSPPGGVTAGLWLGWEVALFLAATALLLGAAAAGGAAIGPSRGAPPLVAPVLATIAALLGPVALDSAGRWPPWYTVLWIVVIGALALTRRHRALVLTAASVAALGATTLTWNAGVRGRIALAERDVASLGVEEPSVRGALERFAEALSQSAPPRTAGDLLRQFVRSDLVGTGYPTEMISWTAGGPPRAELSLADFESPAQEVSLLVGEALRAERPVIEPIMGTPGLFQVLAVPHDDGTVTTVVVAPRTRLIPDDPFIPLVGLESRDAGEPPYAMSLVELDPAPLASEGITNWYREGSELHGDRVVATARGPARAHIEVELRSLDLLIERGALVVIFDLLILIALWAFTVLADDAFGRWLRGRLKRWTSSFRSRLTLALFAFFVVPAAIFAIWSYRRLQQEDRQSRELLVSELLRTLALGGNTERLQNTGGRLDTPLLIYHGGVLNQSSKPVFEELAPTGRLLPPRVQWSLEAGREVTVSGVQRVGDVSALFGFRAITESGSQRVVLAAPARGSEHALQQRRRDLGVLVLFSTVLGGMAALLLSGVVARSLAEPIGRLRRAALAIAGGEREPPLAGTPPAEFVPVFSAFRRMASDLGESQAALEAAQRRTSAVLRNVASGVIAVSADGVVTLANPQAERLLGRETAPGTPLDAALPQELAGRVGLFLQSGEDEEEFDLLLDGRQHHARLTRLSGGGRGAVITLDDVSELARAQRVLAWGEMARQVAHEIKNPLTPIRLGVQHLKRAHADARPDFDVILDQNVSRILAEIDRLDEIARGFSRYGTIPAERLPAEPTDAARVAREVVELERMGRDGVAWHVTGVENPLLALARDEELHEVLLNLLENARHAAARRVELRGSRSDDHVFIEVEDDGHGIPFAVLPRIFEPHFSTRTSGSGLGLAISRQLVEGWGGEITIDSTEGSGTTVRLRLRVPRQAMDASRDG